MATVDSFKLHGMIEIPATVFTLDGFDNWVHSSDFPDRSNFPETPKLTFVAGTVIVETVASPDELIGIHIPPDANTLEGFSRWVYSTDFPDAGKISFIDGRILIDMSPERYESHNKLKAALNAVIYLLAEENDLGEYYPDGARFKNEEANISNEPDAMFATWETLENCKLAPPPTDIVEEGKHIDLYGTPDWVCEALSDSSVTKDTKILLESYHKAGIPEYWLVDARGEEIDFQVLVWQPEGYVNQDDHDGWKFSPVFDRHFQFTRERNRVGTWRYRLQHRQD